MTELDTLRSRGPPTRRTAGTLSAWPARADRRAPREGASDCATTARRSGPYAFAGVEPIAASARRLRVLGGRPGDRGRHRVAGRIAARRGPARPPSSISSIAPARSSCTRARRARRGDASSSSVARPRRPARHRRGPLRTRHGELTLRVDSFQSSARHCVPRPTSTTA